MWKVRHLVWHHGGPKGECVLCHVLLHESEKWWVWYVIAAWGMMEYALLHG